MGGRSRQLIARRLAAFLSLPLFVPGVVHADARVVLVGHEARVSAGGVRVELHLKNEGDKAATRVFVGGSSALGRAEAEVAALGVGAETSVTLDFASGVPRPGRFALMLELEWRPEEPPESPPRIERRCVLLELGARPAPAVRVSLSAEPLDVSGYVSLTLESADTKSHRVHLELVPPQGINVWEPAPDVEVPAVGAAVARARLLRGSAARGQRHVILAVASPIDGELQRDALGEGTVNVVSDPAILPRLRPALVVAGALLLLVATALEWQWRRRSRVAPPDDAPTG